MELKHILEALLFSSQKPLAAKELREIFRTLAKESELPEEQEMGKVKLDDIEQALAELATETEALGRTFRLLCIADRWQYVSLPAYAPWIRVMVGERNRPPRLSPPALETLAIIAYRQPLTRAEMEQIRGVSVDGVVSTLVERGLVEKVGQAEVPGRPALYGTTEMFLEYFGLARLEELPAADELRKIEIKKPETLTTTEPELETAPKEEPVELKDVEPGAAEPDAGELEFQQEATNETTADAPEDAEPADVEEESKG